ncbi:MAG: hypothetical protein ACRD4R_07190 [Candidatus Acidiferrales bacterium]
MKAFKPAAIVGLFLLSTLPAVAQMGLGRESIPSGIFNPVVGGGAVYESDLGNGRKTTLEMAIVGKQAVNGKDGYWIEVTMSGTPMGDLVVKTLAVVTDGNLVTSKTIMQLPGRPPMEMPAQMQAANGQVNLADIRTKSDDLGTESVTTPAGTFTCHHYRMKDGSGDSWVSESVRPFGLVKNEDKGSSMVLMKTLTDVKDKVTGTPQPFNPMMMMPQQPSH